MPAQAHSSPAGHRLDVCNRIPGQRTVCTAMDECNRIPGQPWMNAIESLGRALCARIARWASTCALAWHVNDKHDMATFVDIAYLHFGHQTVCRKSSSSFQLKKVNINRSMQRSQRIALSTQHGQHRYNFAPMCMCEQSCHRVKRGAGDEASR